MASWRDRAVETSAQRADGNKCRATNRVTQKASFTLEINERPEINSSRGESGG